MVALVISILALSLLSLSLTTSQSQSQSQSHSLSGSGSGSPTEMETSTDGSKAPEQMTLAERITRAVEYHKSGNLEAALCEYEEVLPLIPDQNEAVRNTKSSLHGNAGALHNMNGDYEAASKHLEAAMNLTPVGMNFSCIVRY